MTLRVSPASTSPQPQASAPAAHPCVTIVMPSYNAEGCIMRAIDSALAQTFDDFELVVVDDGSTDRTAALVERAASHDERIRLIRIGRNCGPAHARNAAIAAARGEWIALLDADDAWRSQRLTRLLEQSAEADAVFDNLAGHDARGCDTEALFPAFPDGTFTIDMLLSPRAPGSRYDFGYLKPIMRRAFLLAKGLRYDESLRSGEDLLLYAALILEGARTRTVGAPLYVYTLPQATARSHVVPRDEEMRIALERLRERFAGRLAAGAARALEQRIAFLAHIRPISMFYHARARGDVRAMAALLMRERAVRREVAAKVRQRLQSRGARTRRSVGPT
jgi:succinoglycan biosynthesis protein ExoO